jgi:hypothetical protein
VCVAHSAADVDEDKRVSFLEFLNVYQKNPQVRQRLLCLSTLTRRLAWRCTQLLTWLSVFDVASRDLPPATGPAPRPAEFKREPAQERGPSLVLRASSAVISIQS